MRKAKLVAVMLGMALGILLLPSSTLLAQLSHSVTGSGEVTKPLEVFRSTVSAHEDPDGAVWGVVIVNLELLTGETVIFHNQVVCLDVDGSDAWIGGMVTNSTDESIVAVGQMTITLVRDLGGSGDFMDGAVFPNDVTCKNRPLLPGYEVTKGNFNVF